MHSSPRHLYDPEFARLGYPTFKAIVEANNDLCSVVSQRPVHSVGGGGVSVLHDTVAVPNASMRLRCLVKAMLLLKGGAGDGGGRLAPLMEATVAVLEKQESTEKAFFAAAAAAVAKAVLESEELSGVPAQADGEVVTAAPDAVAAEAPAPAGDVPQPTGLPDHHPGPEAAQPPEAGMALTLADDSVPGDATATAAGFLQGGRLLISDLDRAYGLLYGTAFGDGLTSALGALRDVCRMDGDEVLPPLRDEESEAMNQVRTGRNQSWAARSCAAVCALLLTTAVDKRSEWQSTHFVSPHSLRISLSRDRSV